MKQILQLSKAYITGVSILSKGRRSELFGGKQKWIYPLILFGLVSAIGSFSTLLIMNYRSLYQLGAAYGHPDFLIFMALMASWLLSLILGFISALSILYRSKDLQLLATLPVTGRAIVRSRIVIAYGAMLPLHLLVTAPAAVIFISRYGFVPGQITALLTLFFAGSVFPLMISLLLASLITRSAMNRRFRTLFEIGGMLLLLSVIILFQSILTRMSGVTDIESSAVYQFLADRLDRFYSDIPPLGWMSEGFTEQGMLAQLKFLLLSIISVGAVERAVSKRYQKILSQSIFSAGESVNQSRKQRESEQKERGVLPSLVWREWQVLKGHSIFILQTFLELSIVPLLLIVMTVTGSIGEIRQAVSFVLAFPEIELLLFGILQLAFLFSSLSSTSISREGRTLMISRLLPIPPSFQILSKLVLHLLLTYPAYLIYLSLLFILLPLNPLHLIYMIPGGLVFLSLSSVLGLFVDLKRPMLTWIHPQQAIKQNLNVLIGFGLNAAAVGAIGGIGYLLLRFADALSPLVIGVVVIITAGAVLAGLRYPLMQAAKLCYNSEER